MKKITNLLSLLALSLTLVLGGCQKEEEEFIDETENPDTFTANSNLTQLLLSASQNDGSEDNVIDGSDCTALVYPVNVVANGQELTLESVADIATVEAIFDQFPDDTDTLELLFPITLITEDFETITVNNQAEWDAALANCVNNIIDTYACVEFQYPISCFIYNETNEQTNTITLTTNYEWFEYLIYLQEGIYVAIDYPMTLVVNGETVVVNSNQELNDAIVQADCSGGGTPNETEFESLITSGEWFVTYFFDDFDETANYSSYTFTFSQDGNAVAANTIGNTPGTWDYLVDSGVEKLDLYFGTNAPLDELDEDWEILEATQDIIRLRNESGDGSLDYLTYERTPYSGGGGNLNDFITELTTGNWYVNFQEDDGVDETCDYVAYMFTFSSTGSVSAVSDTDTRDGFWSATEDGTGIDLTLNFNTIGTDDPFEDLNDDWDVENYSSLSVALMDVSGGGGGTDYLTFGRDPYTGCGGGGGGQDLIDILIDGSWKVGTYLDDGVDETYNYYYYSLTFDIAGTVVATNGTNTFNGTWSVVGTTDLTMIMDFGTQIPFDEFNDDWDVLSYTLDTVTLEDVSGGGGGTDTLIFEKL